MYPLSIRNRFPTLTDTVIVHETNRALKAHGLNPDSSVIFPSDLRWLLANHLGFGDRCQGIAGITKPMSVIIEELYDVLSDKVDSGDAGKHTQCSATSDNDVPGRQR